MVEFVTGDFFDYEANIRVNTVNCVGVMGAGVALEFKLKYPQMFKSYVKACKNNEIQPGKPQVYDASDLFKQCIIINFPTKTDWRLPSKYEYIEGGLIWLRRFLMDYDEKCNVTLPALGCGHGGLDWEQVKTLIIQYLDDLKCHIYSFPPASSNSHFNNEYFSDELKKCNASIVTSEADDYLNNTGEDKPFYIKGNRENLKRKKVHLLLSKTKDAQTWERECTSLLSISSALTGVDFAFSIAVANQSDKKTVIKLLKNGFYVIIFVNEGIIRAGSDNSYEPYWDYLTVVSYESPKSTYKRVTMKNNERAAKSADAVILCNSNLDDIMVNNNFIMPFLRMSSKAFYIKYWNGRIGIFSDNNIEAIGVNVETKKPNIKTLKETLESEA